MMKNKLFVTMAFMGLLCGGAYAQTTFGVRAGINFQNMNGKIAGKSESGDLALKYHVGVNAEIGIAEEFYVQPGLLYSTKGSEDGDFKTNISYLELPFNLLYKPQLGDGKLIVAFGPYLGYAIGGKFKNGDNEVDIEFGSDEESDDLKPFDMGANISFGYEMSNNLSFQLNTQLGLINLLPGGDSDNSVKNTGFGLSVGYRF